MILQMPSGVPVAAVALDGAENAGFLPLKFLQPLTKRSKKRWLRIKMGLLKK